MTLFCSWFLWVKKLLFGLSGVLRLKVHSSMFLGGAIHEISDVFGGVGWRVTGVAFW